jgi:hypothetical protein
MLTARKSYGHAASLEEAKAAENDAGKDYLCNLYATGHYA